MFTTFARNAMLTGFPGTHLSAHSAYSSTGANEIAGGTPAYARKAVTYGASAAEARAASNTPTFDIPAGATVRFIGMWDALTAGNFLGMIANGGTEQEFSVDITADTVKVPAHGFVADQKVAFYGGTVPGGLVEGTVYFVRNPATDTFQVGATAGGAAINITSEPSRSCVVATIVEEAFGAQGTLAITPHSVRLDA